MKTYRFVIVDDSAVARAHLRDVIRSEPDFEVAYAAPNASLAFEYLAKNPVDLVCLDVEMPKINGIEALREIRKRWPSIPVLMCSSLTLRGAETTLNALAEGASDCIAKPTASTSKERFSGEFRSKLRALVTARRRPAPVRTTRSATRPSAPRGNRRVQALGIGCSTGGPAALATMFERLYRPLSVPLFIVQHMPALFTKLLAERLSAQSGQVVKEGEDGEVAKPGVCYLAPGGRHMTVERKGVDVRISLHDGPEENFCRPAVDVLFRGLAEVYGGDVLATVLTGMGRDGTRGAEALVDAGSRIIVQQPDSCVVPSMPSGVIEAGAAHEQLSLADIGRRFDDAGAASTLRRASGI